MISLTNYNETIQSFFLTQWIQILLESHGQTVLVYFHSKMYNGYVPYFLICVLKVFYKIFQLTF